MIWTVVRNAMLVVFVCRGLQAQQARERDDVHLRNSCRLAAQVLATGRPHPHYEWARDLIGACDESGGPALAALWRTDVSEDRDELGRLVYVTSRLRDQRILDALLETARAPSPSVQVRLSAVRVLVSYFAPGRDAPLECLQEPPFGSPLTVLGHFAPLDGAQPLAPSARDAILALLRELAQSDPNPQVRSAARFVKEGLESILRVEAGP
ncbi:MAG: hypothetical protein ACRD88_01415 [Terriglobia bacterium]